LGFGGYTALEATRRLHNSGGYKEATQLFWRLHKSLDTLFGIWRLHNSGGYNEATRNLDYF
jgi:hypothetical protein